MKNKVNQIILTIIKLILGLLFWISIHGKSYTESVAYAVMLVALTIESKNTKNEE